MDREEILLREYDSCRQLNSMTEQRFWTLTGFFITVNAFLFGWITTTLINTLRPLDCLLAVAFIFISVVMLLLVVVFWLYIRRVTFVVGCNYDRMREIEADLHMWQSCRVHGIDNYIIGKNRKTTKKGEEEKGNHFQKDAVSKEMEGRMIEYHSLDWWRKMRSKGYRGAIGPCLLYGLYSALGLFWCLMLATVIVILICY